MVAKGGLEVLGFTVVQRRAPYDSEKKTAHCCFPNLRGPFPLGQVRPKALNLRKSLKTKLQPETLLNPWPVTPKPPPSPSPRSVSPLLAR